MKQRYFSLIMLVSVLTAKAQDEQPAMELVVPPAEMETTEIIISSRSMVEESPIVLYGQMGIVENDLYLQGLSPFCPESWIKGTISEDGATVVFETPQYVGVTSEKHNDPVWITSSPATAPLVMDWSSETHELSCQTYVENYSPSVVINYDIYSNVKIAPYKRDTAIVPPAEMETYGISISGRAEEWERDTVFYGKIGFIDEDVYIQGLSSVCPESWVKGTFSEDGATVLFDSPQYAGAIPYYRNKSIWISSSSVASPLAMDWSSETRKLSCEVYYESYSPLAVWSHEVYSNVKIELLNPNAINEVNCEAQSAVYSLYGTRVDAQDRGFMIDKATNRVVYRR